MRFEMIIASVKTEISETIIDAGKEAGATGATIISARGTGMNEAKTFFGLTLEVQTDILMFLVEEHIVDDVLSAISEAGKFKEPGTGIAFSLPVNKVVGMESQIEKFKKEVRDNYF